MNKDLLDEIPNNVKRFRFENSLMWVGKDDSIIDVYVKNVDENFHIHFFAKDEKTGMAITREDRRGEPDEHAHVNPSEFLTVLKDAVISTWKILDQINPKDPSFSDKKTILYSIPEISLDRIKSRKAYFKQDFMVEETVFDKIDVHQTKFGSILDEKERETHLVFIRNGEIYGLDLKKLDQVEKVFKNDPRLKALSDSSSKF